VLQARLLCHPVLLSSVQRPARPPGAVAQSLSPGRPGASLLFGSSAAGACRGQRVAARRAPRLLSWGWEAGVLRWARELGWELGWGAGTGALGSWGAEAARRPRRRSMWRLPNCCSARGGS